MNRPDVLYIVHRFPYPPDKGDRIRAYNILRYLTERANVWVATLSDEDVLPEQIEHLKTLTTRLEVVPTRSLGRLLASGSSLFSGKSISEGSFGSGRLRNLIAAWSDEVNFSSVLISASSLAGYLTPFEQSDSQLVVDLVDVDSEKWKQYAKISTSAKRIIYQREYRKVRQLELRLLERADAITLVSRDEANLFRTICSEQQFEESELAKIHAVTNGVDLDFFSPTESPQGGSLCFLGAMDYRPNVEAVCWFAKQVWPLLRETHPDLRFNIVGRNPAPEVAALKKHPGIHVTGAVDDVRSWLAKAAAVIAPLRIARGVQNKVLEAMAMGRAVVASPEALTGLKVIPGSDVLQADSPQDWCEQLDRLLQSAQLREQLERAARQYVEEHHSWTATLEPFDELLGLHAAEVGTLA